MAFKILNEEQLSLLNDNQQQQYKNELSLYQQRVDFVDRIEALEKAEIEPYVPKLKEIDVIVIKEVIPFSNSKFNMIPFNSAVKPSLRSDLFNKEKAEGVNLSAFSKTSTGVREVIRHGYKNIAVLSSKINYINKSEERILNVPKLQSPILVEKKFYEISNVLPNVINKAKPNYADIKSFVMPQKPKLNLTNVCSANAEIKSFNNPQFTKTTVPTINRVDFKRNNFISPEITKVDLPKVEKVNFRGNNFINPQQPVLNLATDTKSNVEIKSFAELKINKTILQKADEINLITNTFVNPIQPILALKTNIKPSIETKVFKQSKFTKIKLTKQEIISPALKDFQSIEHQIVEPIPIIKPNLKTRSFNQSEFAKAKLPKIPKVNINFNKFQQPKKASSQVSVEITAPVQIKKIDKLKMVKAELPNVLIQKNHKLDANANDVLAIMNKEFEGMLV